MVADNLPNEQIDVIIEMFNMMDTDDNGYLSFEELRDGLQKMGHSVGDPDVRMLMEAVSFFFFLITRTSSIVKEYRLKLKSFCGKRRISMEMGH